MQPVRRRGDRRADLPGPRAAVGRAVPRPHFLIPANSYLRAGRRHFPRPAKNNCASVTKPLGTLCLANTCHSRNPLTDVVPVVKMQASMQIPREVGPSLTGHRPAWDKRTQLGGVLSHAAKGGQETWGVWGLQGR